MHYCTGEENYRQMISRVKTPEEAALALEVLDEGRRLRAVLQQHVPFTFHTSQLMITVLTLLPSTYPYPCTVHI